MADNNILKLGIAGDIVDFIICAEAELTSVFARLDAIEISNQAKVLTAFQRKNIGARHFAPTTGYGYDDIGRDALDSVFAYALDSEDALVRPQLISGTHAIFTALSGLLEPGDAMLAITGVPYDTLRGAIGITGNESSSLKRCGIDYMQTELCGDECDEIDIAAVTQMLDLKPNIKVVYVQRSRGYSWRNALDANKLKNAFAVVKAHRPDVIIMVDNCYGEFTQTEEPSAYGADVIVGSLIKNPGGGIAPTGGYIAGKADYIERISNRLTVPGIGREAGSYAGSYIPFFQGLFLAPHVTMQSLKSAVLFAKVFEKLGMVSMPKSDAMRSDIVQSIRFDSADALIAFCQSIQKAAPIDSYAVPEPWAMPGYDDKVIMAAGAFIQGASIELSADAPIKKPYTAYIQGGLTYSHGRLGAMFALSELVRIGLVHL
ncbi:MAG: methionine gamma-lyase family protein [Clostridia bacterium]